MSIKCASLQSFRQSIARGPRRRRSLLYIRGFVHWACLLFGLLGGGGLRRDLDVGEVVERFILRQRQLAVLVDPLLALLDLLGGRLARRGAQRAGREIDPELLRRAEQLVVLSAHLAL